MKTASDLTQIRVGWWKSGKIGLKRGWKMGGEGHTTMTAPLFTEKG